MVKKKLYLPDEKIQLNISPLSKTFISFFLYLIKISYRSILPDLISFLKMKELTKLV
jgi:hypothetical protein